MSLEELLRRTVNLLEAERIPYMITGSLASSFHGEYRATRDIDIVIDPRADDLDRLLRRLQADGLYVDAEAARLALSEQGQFNAIVGDLKVDLIVLKSDPFSVSEFGRRIRARLLDVDADLITVEDLVLAKLAWARDLDSERQLRDVAGMVSVSGDALDRTYVTDWAERLGLGEAWRRVASP
jgi:hypothetical protein